MSEPFYSDASVTLHAGDCLDVLRSLPDNSVDAVCTDPPYGIRFMGQAWDGADILATTERWRETNPMPREVGGPHGGYRSLAAEAGRYNRDTSANRQFQQWVESWAIECLRVLKPGGHLLASGSSRTGHRLTAGIEDAGFEIRDSIAWLYGSGFPKSLDVSKAIDKVAHVNDETHRRIALVAEVIRTHREAKGMERAAVSLAVVGTPSGACWNWEHQQLPSVEMWPAIKRTLDIPDKFDGLIEGTREMFIGAERAVIGERRTGIGTGRGAVAYIADSENRDITAPATPDAERWQGWGTALKPAHEPVVVARKPHTEADILARIGSQLDALEDACRQRASGVASSSAPTRRASREVMTATAPASAATPHEGEPERTIPTGAVAGSSAATATSASASAAKTLSNTVTSWRACWAELCEATSTSTTSTAISRTTDLQTLSSCLSKIMQGDTETSTLAPDSWSSLASVVDYLFAAGVLSSRSTLALSAIESATDATPPDSLDAEGTSPHFEPIVVARKPLVGTVAANVLAHGTGALNIDGCRVGDGEGVVTFERADDGSVYDLGTVTGVRPSGQGRWPASVILDESQAEVLDEQSGTLTSGANPKRRGADKLRDAYGDFAGQEECDPARGADSGGASRFFYVAKADASERVRVNGTAHPTVKPLALMRWLVRLITPPGGTVLEPFAGSGTTVEACLLEGFRCIAIEREADYLPLIVQRINRRRDPVAAVRSEGGDVGLFELLEEEGA